MDDDVGVLSRTVQILSCFSEHGAELSAVRLAELTGIPTSSLHRLLAQLVRHGLLARMPRRRYAIGTRLWEFGELSPLSLRLREASLPHLIQLYEATHENVHVAVLDATTPESASALYVGRVRGAGSVPIVSRMGGRHPLHTTGVGKALLAAREDSWIERFLRQPLASDTTHSLTDPDALRADIARTRERRYAVTREEKTLGSASVAVALRQIDGLPPIALGVVVGLDRADERRLAPLVTQAAYRLRSSLVAHAEQAPRVIV